MTLLAAVGRVFPCRFLAPQAALQEKGSSIFNVMKFRDSVNKALINYGRQIIDRGEGVVGGESQYANKKEQINTYLLLIVNFYVPSFLKIDFLPHFTFVLKFNLPWSRVTAAWYYDRSHSVGGDA